MMHLLAYADGQQDLLSIADIINVPMWELLPILEELEKHGLISSVENGWQYDRWFEKGATSVEMRVYLAQILALGILIDVDL